MRKGEIKPDFRLDHKPAYRVDIIESERGWGHKIEETVLFDTEQHALDYVKKFNALNPVLTHTPDWYMLARYVGEMK